MMKKLKNPFEGMEGYNCFGCSHKNPIGVKLDFYEDGDYIVSYWKPTPDYQGWFHVLHGGIQSVLLDEIAGWTVMRKLQVAGVTSRMETHFLRSVSSDDNRLTLRAHIVKQIRHIVQIECMLYNSKDELCTKAICTYYTFDKEKSKEMHFTECKAEDEE